MTQEPINPAIRRGTAHDLPFVMATERGPGFEHLVGRWPQERHAIALASPDYAYLIGGHADADAGFAILRDLNDGHGNVCLMRIAVENPSRGFGRRFLPQIIEWVFTETTAERFWLDTFTDNLRAQHVYRTCGFIEEGVKRSAYRMPDGTRRDLLQFSLIRPEWPAEKI
jgi:RimJ/RimL family protein N-acetyltransferase